LDFLIKCFIRSRLELTADIRILPAVCCGHGKIFLEEWQQKQLVINNSTAELNTQHINNNKKFTTTTSTSCQKWNVGNKKMQENQRGAAPTCSFDVFFLFFFSFLFSAQKNPKLLRDFGANFSVPRVICRALERQGVYLESVYLDGQGR
jgi:hypothetical protein